LDPITDPLQLVFQIFALDWFCLEQSFILHPSWVQKCENKAGKIMNEEYSLGSCIFTYLLHRKSIWNCWYSELFSSKNHLLYDKTSKLFM